MYRHESWFKYEPQSGENLENHKSYYERLTTLKCEIPREIIHQWIFPHYNNANSQKNYSWIDLESVRFELKEYATSFFEDLNIIEDNREMVNKYSIYDFPFWHRRFWANNGTWETPPIVINVNLFINEKPVEAELNGNFQLVEGHNRLGTLKLSKRDGRFVSDFHKVWILTKKNFRSE